METKNEFVSLSLVHPGQILQMELDERGIAPKTLAEKMGMTTGSLNDYIRRKRNFNVNFALKLEDAIGIPANNWMNMQVNYDLTAARVKRRQSTAVNSSIRYTHAVSAH